MSLPGVATMMWTPFLTVSIVSLTGVPPIAIPIFNLKNDKTLKKDARNLVRLYFDTFMFKFKFTNP